MASNSGFQEDPPPLAPALMPKRVRDLQLGEDAPKPNSPKIDRTSSPLLSRIRNRLRSVSGDRISQRSLRHFMPREVVPHVDLYRHSFSSAQPNRTRPTLDELLHQGSRSNSIITQDVNLQGDIHPQDEKADKEMSQKFGWIEGVYVPCLLNIWGVMLFLRLTWVFGQSGLLQGLALITVANVVTVITTLSMSAVTTNGQIKAGGIYFMISRSLGPEFGGAVGLMFTAANAIAVSMYTIGFCESLLDMLGQYVPGFEGITGTRINDIRMLGSVTVVILVVIAVIGMNLVSKVQIVLLILLVISQVDFIVGTFVPPSNETIAKGFVGYQLETLKVNLWPEYRPENGKEMNFFAVFAVFFPAVTGIVAGANLSGDLKDPCHAIPKGTFMAILTTFISYVLYGIMSSASCLRLASGNISELPNHFKECSDRNCTYGSLVSQQMMQIMSLWGPLIYAGCFAATLSSAIASLVGAPRVFQAVAKDKIFPGIGFFAQGYGKANNPLRGYCLIFVVSVVCILIGDLNQVSSLLSNFFVATYAVINYSTFHASFNQSPGWRPSFHYYNQWVSLLGTILCICVMILMDFKTALATLICVLFLYIFVRTRNLNVNWGSSTQSESFLQALKSVHTLARVDDHVKTYRPKLIVLTGPPLDRPVLVDFANLITKRISLLELAHIVTEDLDLKTMKEMKHNVQDWLHENHIKAFYALTRNSSFTDGVRTTIELSGLGKLSPNMMLIGFQEHWWITSSSSQEYFKTIQMAFNMHLAVGILRISGGLDVSDMSGAKLKIMETSRQNSNNSEYSTFSRSMSSGERRSSAPEILPFDILKRRRNSRHDSFVSFSEGNPIDERIVQKMTQFKDRTQKEGFIDVYWLCDDGGLTLLLPHILTTRTKFSKCKLRVYFLSKSHDRVEEETRNMAKLLNKFRIEFQDVILLTDATKHPKKPTKEDFKKMISMPMSARTSHRMSISSYDSILSTERDGMAAMSEAELTRHVDKTNFHLRISEIVHENSSNSELVVLSLPLPRSDLPSKLYLAWLDFISKNMPPFLFVRGNQESVLTFYS